MLQCVVQCVVQCVYDIANGGKQVCCSGLWCVVEIVLQCIAVCVAVCCSVCCSVSTISPMEANKCVAVGSSVL